MSEATPEPPDRVGPWDRLLEVAVVLVGAAGALFAGAGALTTSFVEWIVFGAADSPIPGGEAARYVTFVYAVLGAVIFAIAFAVPLVAIRRAGFGS